MDTRNQLNILEKTAFHIFLVSTLQWWVNSWADSIHKYILTNWLIGSGLSNSSSSSINGILFFCRSCDHYGCRSSTCWPTISHLKGRHSWPIGGLVAGRPYPSAETQWAYSTARAKRTENILCIESGDTQVSPRKCYLSCAHQMGEYGKSLSFKLPTVALTRPTRPNMLREPSVFLK